MALVMESIDYYNLEVIPYLTPAHLPFRRNAIPTDFWHFVPPILKHMWIVIVKTRQASRTLSDPLLRPDLVYYRGRSLTELQKMLTAEPSGKDDDCRDVVKDPYGVALMSVLFLMGADMQLCEEHWTSHLEAARRIITLRGGLGKCLIDFSGSKAPLIGYLYVDITTPILSNSWILNSTVVRAQLEYLGLLPNLEQELLGNSHPCPAQILQAIVQTNILRVCSQRSLTDVERQDVAKHDVSFETALNTIENFDAQLWALRISGFGRTLPQRPNEELSQSSIVGLASLAQCYKNAAKLYLLLSVPSASSPDDLVSAQSTLSQNLNNVFDKAKIDHNGPLYTQLWKYTVFPLFISIYVKAAYDIGSEQSIDKDVDRLPAIAMAFGSRRLLSVGKFVRGVQEKRVAKPDRAWSWDDGFGNRLTFAI